MGQKSSTPEVNSLIRRKLFNFFGITFVFTVLPVAILAAIGYLIDLSFGTKPYGLITAVIIALPVGQFLVIKVMKKHANNQLLTYKNGK